MDMTLSQPQSTKSRRNRWMLGAALVIAALVIMALFIATLELVNTLIMSIYERTREIGIRLSLGARSSDILTQFLLEAVVLSLTGGLIGIILSVAIAGILNSWTEINTLINPLIVILSFTFSGTVGIFFGFYPARKAAGLNPIDALRYE